MKTKVDTRWTARMRLDPAVRAPLPAGCQVHQRRMMRPLIATRADAAGVVAAGGVATPAAAAVAAVITRKSIGIVLSLH